jgi:hypothetical protein
VAVEVVVGAAEVVELVVGTRLVDGTEVVAGWVPGVGVVAGGLWVPLLPPVVSSTTTMITAMRTSTPTTTASGCLPRASAGGSGPSSRYRPRSALRSASREDLDTTQEVEAVPAAGADF